MKTDVTTRRPRRWTLRRDGYVVADCVSLALALSLVDASTHARYTIRTVQ